MQRLFTPSAQLSVRGLLTIHSAPSALRSGAKLSVGIDHANYAHANDALPETTREALLADFA